MPIGDWQFWVVSLLCLGAAWLVLRGFIPRKKRTSKRKVELTIGGDKVKGKRKTERGDR